MFNWRVQMDYEKMTSEQFKNEIARRREGIFAKTYRMGSIQAEVVLRREYEDLCADAAGGDPIAEDILAEWFRNGNNIVPENIESSMKWLFLAGANGNKYSLDRLKLHFAFAFDRIIALKDFGKIALKFDIDEYNYQYTLGKLICDGVVDELNIDPLELAKQKPIYIPFSGIIMRRFDRVINSAVDRVIEYLRR